MTDGHVTAQVVIGETVKAGMQNGMEYGMEHRMEWIWNYGETLKI